MPAFTTSQLAAALGAWARVDKPSAVISLGVEPYFDVSGRVLIHYLCGRISVGFTDTGEATNNVKLIANPAEVTAADTDLCDVVNLEEAVAETYLTITGTKTDAMVKTLEGAIPGQAISVLVRPGTIDLSVEHAELITPTGETTWSILYTPIDVGATITVHV
jgi:hypothetical protein